MLQRSFFAVIAVLGLAATANAGAMHLYLKVDPATTAGAGIPAAGGFNITSTRSGAGTWHLYAVDDVDGSFGIAQVKAQMVGATHISNRNTQTLYDTASDVGFKAGLTLLRSASGNVPGGANPITASMELPGTQPATVGGLGITAGNYADAIADEIGFSGTVNGQWGNYATSTAGVVQATGHTRAPLFIAEGAYAGQVSVDLAQSFIAYWTNAGFTTSSQAAGTSGLNPGDPFIPEPATVSLLGLALLGGFGYVRRRS
jgi:hypothetical protein